VCHTTQDPPPYGFEKECKEEVLLSEFAAALKRVKLSCEQRDADGDDSERAAEAGEYGSVRSRVTEWHANPTLA